MFDILRRIFGITGSPKVGTETAIKGFDTIPPLTEGYVNKGGRNRTTQILVRPPPPPRLSQGGRAPATAPAETAENQ